MCARRDAGATADDPGEGFLQRLSSRVIFIVARRFSLRPPTLRWHFAQQAPDSNLFVQGNDSLIRSKERLVLETTSEIQVARTEAILPQAGLHAILRT